MFGTARHAHPCRPRSAASASRTGRGCWPSCTSPPPTRSSPFSITKYFYNFWRPVTAIRAADTDATKPDAGWLPLAPIPTIPSIRLLMAPSALPTPRRCGTSFWHEESHDHSEQHRQRNDPHLPQHRRNHQGDHRCSHLWRHALPDLGRAWLGDGKKGRALDRQALLPAGGAVKHRRTAHRLSRISSRSSHCGSMQPRCAEGCRSSCW